MGKEKISENEYIGKLRSVLETPELNWEFIGAAAIEFWFTQHGIERPKNSRDLVETGIRFVTDNRKIESVNHRKLRLEIPGNVRDYLYMELSEKGALLVSKDFYFKPDQNWLREISVGNYAFTFVFGDNPMKTGGKDRFYINYAMKMEKRVDRIPD